MPMKNRSKYKLVVDCKSHPARAVGTADANNVAAMTLRGPKASFSGPITIRVKPDESTAKTDEVKISFRVKSSVRAISASNGVMANQVKLREKIRTRDVRRSLGILLFL